MNGTYTLVMLLRKYVGKGKFVFELSPQIELDASFEIDFSSTGKLSITTQFKLLPDMTALINSQKNQVVTARLDSILEDNGKISVTKMLLDHTKMQANEYSPNRCKQRGI